MTSKRKHAFAVPEAPSTLPSVVVKTEMPNRLHCGTANVASKKVSSTSSGAASNKDSGAPMATLEVIEVGNNTDDEPDHIPPGTPFEVEFESDASTFPSSGVWLNLQDLTRYFGCVHHAKDYAAKAGS